MGIETRILRKTDPDCKGKMTTQVCMLSPSRMEYKLFMDNEGNVTFRSSDWKSDVVVQNVYVLRSSSLLHTESALSYPINLPVFIPLRSQHDVLNSDHLFVPV